MVVVFVLEAMGFKFLPLLSALCWMGIRGLWKLSDGRDWLWRKLGLDLVGRAMFNKSLIQFSAGSVLPPYSLAWGDPVLESTVSMVGLQPLWLCWWWPPPWGFMPTCHASQDYCCQCPWPCGRPLSTHASAEDSQTLTGKSGSVSFGGTAVLS